MQKSPYSVIPNRADMYVFDRNEKKYKHNFVQKTSSGGDYYILTTANDLEKWAAAFYHQSSKIRHGIFSE